MGVFEWIVNNFGSFIFWGLFFVVVLLFAITAFRNMNHNYTAGSGMFKNSGYDLDSETKKDASDFNYYDTEGKSK